MTSFINKLGKSVGWYWMHLWHVYWVGESLDLFSGDLGFILPFDAALFAHSK